MKNNTAINNTKKVKTTAKVNPLAAGLGSRATRKKINTVGFNFRKKAKAKEGIPLVGRLYFGLLGVMFLVAACSKKK